MYAVKTRFGSLTKEEILVVLSEIDVNSFTGLTFSEIVTLEYLNQCQKLKFQGDSWNLIKAVFDYTCPKQKLNNFVISGLANNQSLFILN